MTETFLADREAILNKYHRLDRPYNSFQRFAYHGWECDPDTGLDDAGIKAKIREACESSAGQPHPVVQAWAFAAVLDNTRIAISPHDWYVGIYGWGRLPLEFTRNAWNRQLFEEVLPDTAREMAELNRTGTVTLWPDYDHSVPDWDAVFRLGFPGLLERVKRYHEAHRRAGALSEREEAFFQGMEITYEAILRFLQRLRARALALSHAKAAGIAACLGGLLEGGPRDTYQALQLIYLYFMFSESIDGYQVRSLASRAGSGAGALYSRGLGRAALYFRTDRRFYRLFPAAIRGHRQLLGPAHVYGRQQRKGGKPGLRNVVPDFAHLR